MKKGELNIAERLYHSVKQLLDRVNYSQELFEDDVWTLRIAQKQRQRIRYSARQKQFSLSIRSTDDIFKYLLMIGMGLMLIVMLSMSIRVGVSSHELAQDRYSAQVYDHFHRTGDRDAYQNHPFASTQAQYVDLLVYSVCRAFHVNDAFLVRHLLSAFSGWMIVLYLSVLVLKVFNWRAAFFTAFFLFISPRFLGYSLNNLVDVTFAFGFVFAITQIYYFCRELPVIHLSRYAKILAGTFIALSSYNAGFVLLHFLMVFTLLNFLLYNPIRKFFTQQYLKTFGTLCLLLVCTMFIVYGVHSVFTLYMVKSTELPGNAFALLTANYPVAQNQLFKGHLIGPDNFPKNCLSTILFVTTPTIILIGFLLFFIFFKTAVRSLKLFSIFIFLYSFLYCIHKVKSSYMNVDTAWMIYYCIYPLFMVIAAGGIECTLRCIDDKYTNIVVLGIIALLSFMPVRHIVYNRPLVSLYFNEISGGIQNAYGKYELYCNDAANRQACLKMTKHIYRNDISLSPEARKVVVATNGNGICSHFFAPDTALIQLVQKPFNKADTTWDYYLDFGYREPSDLLREGAWPFDTAFYSMNVDTKPIVTFYRNRHRQQQNRQHVQAEETTRRRIDSLEAMFLDNMNLK